MIIDHISDLHIDFIFRLDKGIPNEKQIKVWFNDVFSRKQSNVLMVAGDISEYPKITLEFFKIIQKIYEYDTIFFVFGNHDFWLSTKSLRHDFKENSYNKIKLMKDLCKIHNGSSDKKIYFLDGDVHEIEGIKIAGSMGWYDTTYYCANSHPYTSPDVFAFWNKVMNDSRFVYPRNNEYTWILRTEIEKLDKIFRESPDIVMTHICPVPFDTIVKNEFKGELSNTFYMFNGLDYIYDYSPKVWVYGHMHSRHSLEVNHTLVLRNAHGYPNEYGLQQVTSFEVEK